MAPRTPRRPGRDGDGWWPPVSVPIAVEGGLQAKSRRGQIGDTWWSQRFIALLESFGMGSRLQRGKRYARIGQVLSMEVAAGQVTASVQGSRARPYRVFIETSVLTVAEWDAVESTMASRAAFVAPLLAGEMPREIEEAFAGSSVSLFADEAGDLETACSCPDWGNPCKHIAAVFFLLAEAFDDDPFLIFAWRGRDKEELLAGLRRRRRGRRGTDAADAPGGDAGPGGADDAALAEIGPLGWPPAPEEASSDPQALSPEELWGRPADLAALEIRPRLAVAPDLVLRQLDPSALGEDAERIVAALGPLYEAITSGAATLAFGEDS